MSSSVAPLDPNKNHTIAAMQEYLKSVGRSHEIKKTLRKADYQALCGLPVTSPASSKKGRATMTVVELQAEVDRRRQAGQVINLPAKPKKADLELALNMTPTGKLVSPENKDLYAIRMAREPPAVASSAPVVRSYASAPPARKCILVVRGNYCYLLEESKIPKLDRFKAEIVMKEEDRPQFAIREVDDEKFKVSYVHDVLNEAIPSRIEVGASLTLADDQRITSIYNIDIQPDIPSDPAFEEAQFDLPPEGEEEGEEYDVDEGAMRVADMLSVDSIKESSPPESEEKSPSSPSPSEAPSEAPRSPPRAQDAQADDTDSDSESVPKRMPVKLPARSIGLSIKRK